MSVYSVLEEFQSSLMPLFHWYPLHSVLVVFHYSGVPFARGHYSDAAKTTKKRNNGGPRPSRYQKNAWYQVLPVEEGYALLATSLIVIRG